MLRKVRVNPKTGVLYIPKELLRDGFKGDMDALVNAMTFTLIHPEADLEKVRESLEIVLRDIELRLNRGGYSSGRTGGREYSMNDSEDEA